MAHSSGDDVYAVQMSVTLNGRLDPNRLHEAVQAVVQRHPNLVARFCDQFGEPVQVIPADPVVPWQYIDLNSASADFAEQIAQLCTAERGAVCDLAEQKAFRAMLIRIAPDQHQLVLTNHHIVLDGWSVSVLLQEVFAGYYGQRLPPAVPYRRFISWLASQDTQDARSAWREALAGFDTPTLVGPRDRLGLGPRNVASHRVSTATTLALNELARSHHTTVSTVLHAAWSQLLMSMTGQSDIAFGVVVAGRPTDLAGVDSMVGLLINTVPQRVSISPDTTTADLLDQLQNGRSRTFEQEHLGLNEIHRVTGHSALFDTVFVYENYPTDTSLLSGADGLSVTDVTSRDYYHYPLTIQALPGSELDLRIQYRTDVFDDNTIARLIGELDRALVTMATNPGQSLAPSSGWDNPALTIASTPERRASASGYTAPATDVEQILCDMYAQVLGVDRVGVDDAFFELGGDSLSAMRLVAAIRAALDIPVTLPAVFGSLTVRKLSQRIKGESGTTGQEPKR
jgi:acyl carrier protein